MSEAVARPDVVARLADAIRSRSARVCIVGMGYVGLPLAQTFLDAGFPVIGFDIDPEKVTSLRKGRSYIERIPSASIAAMRAGGRFDVSNDPAVFAQADAILICVPTPLTANGEPDLSYVEATGESIAPHLQEGHLVVLESTTYPGTTEDILRPILERGGLRAEQDFFLAFSPEREDPGNRAFVTRTIPKVVGGVGPKSAELAQQLYAGAVDEVVPVTDTRVAEACKILENTYRAVNIALVNELKVLFDRMGVDVWEVIEAARTKPFGYQAFYPGPGLGGHCIPIDPFYLTWVARQYGLETQFIELAGRVNTAMPQYVVGRVAEALETRGRAIEGSRILVLGIAYKPDIDDTRESPAFPIITDLLERGAQVGFHDPFFQELPKKREFELDVPGLALTAENVAAQDCVLIVTDHASYDYPWLAEHAPLIVDTRGAMRSVPGARNVHPA